MSGSINLHPSHLCCICHTGVRAARRGTKPRRRRAARHRAAVAAAAEPGVGTRATAVHPARGGGVLTLAQTLSMTLTLTLVLTITLELPLSTLLEAEAC